MATTYEPIATTTLTSNQASVTFSSISSGFTDLILVISAYQSGGTACEVQVNSDTASNYSRTGMYGTGTTAGSFRNSNVTNSYLTLGDAATGNAIVHFMNYSNTTTYKTWIHRENFPTGATYAAVSLWRSTSPITSILLDAGAQPWVSGSSFTLYGIKAA